MISFKKIYMTLLSSALLMTGCADWDDHYTPTSQSENGGTLWEVVQANPNLSDFAEVLTNTKVFRQHKKSSVSYAQYLNGESSLTLLAPVNGTFNKDSIINLLQTAQGDSMVERNFIFNHIVLAPKSAVDAKLTLLNGKYLNMSSANAGGVGYVSKDIHTRNGVLHIIEKPLPYMRTVYETLINDPRFKGIGETLRSYTKDHFNEEASVSNGIVDGVKVYVDSVMYETNDLMDYLGRLNSEDSTYWVALPTQEAWKQEIATAQEHYTYSSDLEKGDSLMRFWAAENLLQDLIFSKTIQASPNDSVISRWYSKTEPEYGVFKNPYDKAEGIFGACTDSIKCSNGVIYFHDDWKVKPTQTYLRKHEFEMEHTWNVTKQNCEFIVREVIADSISRGAFLDVVPNSKTASWNLTYTMQNTLAGKYDVCVVVLPKTVMGAGTTSRTCRFQATIKYIDAEGKQQTYECGNKKTFNTRKEYVDTIVVAEDFVFPACNYDQNNDKISLNIKTNISKTQQASSDNEMYIDCIFLRPKD